MYIVTNLTVKQSFIVPTTWIASCLAKTNKTKPPKAVLFSFYPIISDEVSKRMHIQGAQGSCCEPYFLYGELQLAAVATQQMRAFWKLCLVGF